MQRVLLEAAAGALAARRHGDARGQEDHAQRLAAGAARARRHRVADERLGLGDLRGKVAFMQGDACNLKSLYTGYDLVFAGNLVDRLYDPGMFLDLIAGRVLPGGLLVITSVSYQYFDPRINFNDDPERPLYPTITPVNLDPLYSSSESFQGQNPSMVPGDPRTSRLLSEHRTFR